MITTIGDVSNKLAQIENVLNVHGLEVELTLYSDQSGILNLEGAAAFYFSDPDDYVRKADKLIAHIISLEDKTLLRQIANDFWVKDYYGD